MCSECNFIRIHGKSRFEATLEKEKNKPIVIKRKKKKNTKSKIIIQSKIDNRVQRVETDKNTYFQVFNNLPHKCQECNCDLPNEFLDERGNINMVEQYSHILSKGSHPQFRNKVKNLNRLCLRDHQKWEFGKREEMKIYESNQIIIQELRDEYNNK